MTFFVIRKLHSKCTGIVERVGSVRIIIIIMVVVVVVDIISIVVVVFVMSIIILFIEKGWKSKNFIKGRVRYEKWQTTYDWRNGTTKSRQN